ncbi:MAG TPA: hypothetical protein VG733_08535 [Chthoniobacteraceae bacterium]|nr:hypothetical protein [Chthoniobacteraceae bacterium]
MALVAGTGKMQARENAYDVLGKALVPFVKALVALPDAKSHCATVTLSLDSATNLPESEIGDTLEVALQSPDKMIVRAKALGQQVTVCRNGQKLWAWPGTQIQALLDAQKLPKADPGYKLDAVQLPITEKQLVWLPLLFTAEDEGDDAVNGENCMVLEVSLAPPVAKAIHAEDYTARIWVKADYKIARIVLRKGAGWKAVISVKSLDYPATLPAETWQPNQAEAGDVADIAPSRYKQLLDAVTAKWAGIK